MGFAATGHGESKNPSSMCCFQDKRHFPVRAVCRFQVFTPYLEYSMTEPGTTSSYQIFFYKALKS